MSDMLVLVTHKRPTEGALSKAFNGFRLWMSSVRIYYFCEKTT